MTKRQLETMQLIQAFQAVEGRSPTYQEIADQSGYLSTGSGHNMVVRLEGLGHIERTPGGLKILTPVSICLSCCGGCNQIRYPADMTWIRNDRGQRGSNICSRCLEKRQAA